jgi:dipeptidyl aminopeptidase/acylaminoacyl peptidase
MRFIIFLTLFISSYTLANALPPISAFFEAEKIQSMTLNPSGDKVLIKLKFKRTYILMVMDIATKQKEVVYYEPYRKIDFSLSHKKEEEQEIQDKITKAIWLNDNEIVLLLSLDDGSLKDYLVKLYFNDEQKLSHNFSEINILGYPKKASKLHQRKLLIHSYNRHNGIDNFYWDLDSNDKSEKLNGDLREASYWVFDKNENILVGYGTQDKKNTVWHRTTKKSDWQVIWQSRNRDEVFKPVAIASDNTSILVLHNHERNEVVLQAFTPKTKTFGKVLFSKKNIDVSGVINHPIKNGILAVTYMQSGLLRYYYFDKTYRQLNNKLAKTFPNEQANIINRSRSGRKLIVRTFNHENKGNYYFWDTDKNKMMLLGSKEPKLNKNKNLSSIRNFTTPTSDDFEVESYLTLPKHTHKPPLIVMPHGGPIGVQDSHYFDPHSQLLVSRGFATLKVNYRGSSGYGKKFMFAGHKQWGLSIEDDILKAVNHVLAENIVDETRICIYGASYGGYSALMSIIKYPNKFKCAISFAGVTDIPLMFAEDTRLMNNSYKEALTNIIGDPIKDKAYQHNNSPIYRYKEIKTPLLLIHGTEDSTVSSEHSERLSLLLNKQKVEHDFLLINGAGHGLWSGKQAVIMYEKIFAFLNAQLAKK